jgi:hypothetical protein
VSWQLASIIPVWLLALVLAIVVAVLAPTEGPARWLPVSLALTSFVAFAVQLGIRRKEGFVFRVMASITGAVVVLGAATLLLPLFA